VQVTIRKRGRNLLEKTPPRSIHPAILVTERNLAFAADLAKRANTMHNPARPKLCEKAPGS
jgi:hypothetical protein